MSYKLEIYHKKEEKNGKVTRDEIVMSKTFVTELTGGIEHVTQMGIITFPYSDLQSVIEELKAK